MKTAIKELIDTLKELQLQLNIPIEVIDMCENQLDKEKEQIINAYKEGLWNSGIISSIEYYHKTYNE